MKTAFRLFGLSLGLASLGLIVIAISLAIRSHRPPSWLMLSSAGVSAYAAYLLIRRPTPRALSR